MPLVRPPSRSLTGRKATGASPPGPLLISEPGYPASRSLRQANILQMQQQYGNAYVQRFLTGHRRLGGAGSGPRPKGTLQRKNGEQKKSETKSAAQQMDPLHKKLYELLKKELGDDKLKKHGEAIAKAAAEALMKQAEGASSEADFLKKAQVKLVGEQLNREVKQAVQELLSSPEGKKVRDKILEIFKAEPSMALGSVLLGLALAVAANAPAKLDLDGKFGKSGFKWAAKADLGKLREMSLNLVQASLGYSSKQFSASLTGGYSGEKGKVQTEAKVGVGEKQKVQATTSATVDPKSGEVKVDLGTVLSMPATTIGRVSLPQISLSSKLNLGPDLSGMAAIRLGGAKNYLTTQVNIGSDGKATLQFEHLKTMGALSLGSTFTTGPKASGSHKLSFKPVDVKNLKIDANIKYTLSDPTISEAGFNLKYRLVDKKDAPIPLLIVGANGQYQAKSGDKPQSFQALFVVQGRF